jgi:hypothetical protein
VPRLWIEKASLTSNQGDQIGRIFAQWAVGFLGIVLKIMEVALILGELFSTIKVAY